MVTYKEFQGGFAQEDCPPRGHAAGLVQAARRCASETFSGSENNAVRSESAIRSNTSFMVSWMRVLGLWNFRVAFDASWQSI